MLPSRAEHQKNGFPCAPIGTNVRNSSLGSAGFCRAQRKIVHPSIESVTSGGLSHLPTIHGSTTPFTTIPSQMKSISTYPCLKPKGLQNSPSKLSKTYNPLEDLFRLQDAVPSPQDWLDDRHPCCPDAVPVGLAGFLLRLRC